MGEGPKNPAKMIRSDTSDTVPSTQASEQPQIHNYDHLCFLSIYSVPGVTSVDCGIPWFSSSGRKEFS